MKIAYLSAFYPYRGGIAQFNANLYKALEKGHQVKAFNFKRQYPSLLFPGKTQFTEAEAPSDLKITLMLNSITPYNWIRVGQTIRRQKPDILIIKYWHPFMAPCFGTVARLAARNKSTRVICIFDNVVPHEKSFIDRSLTSYFQNNITGGIVMSGSVLDDLKSFNTDFPVACNPHPLYENYGIPIIREEALDNIKLPADKSFILFF